MNKQVKVNNVKFELENGELLFSGADFKFTNGDRVGVVGKNGSGKTTLLKLILGELTPMSGMVATVVNNYYIPQFKDEKNSLSGGEFIRYHLEQARRKKPGLLVMDEPTNHLDKKGREILQEFIDQYKGILIFVSHDESFLEKNATSIVYFYNKKVSVFGGGYIEYQKYFDEYLQSVKAMKVVLKKEERKLEKEQIRLKEKLNRSKKEGRAQKHDGSMGKLEQGFFKDNSEFSYGKGKIKVDRLQEQNAIRQDNYTLEDEMDLNIVFPETKNKKELLYKIENGSIKIGNDIKLWKIDLELYSKERVRISGENGSGKSLLCKSIIMDGVMGKSYYKQNIKIDYLDQFYELVDKNKTLVDNVFDRCGDLTVSRKILSLYGFKEDYIVSQKAESLSGGEMCRLSLSMICVARVDLLILDEPTNNLDIETKKILYESLQKFTGGLIIISHDENFLNGINFVKEISVEGGKVVVK